MSHAIFYFIQHAKGIKLKITCFVKCIVRGIIMATSNSRLAARISIICFFIFGALVITGKFIMDLPVLIAISFPFLVIGLSIKSFVLRCQACGNRGGIPQWYKNKTIHCPKCGTAYEYDR